MRQVLSGVLSWRECRTKPALGFCCPESLHKHLVCQVSYKLSFKFNFVTIMVANQKQWSNLFRERQHAFLRISFLPAMRGIRCQSDILHMHPPHLNQASIEKNIPNPISQSQCTTTFLSNTISYSDVYIGLIKLSQALLAPNLRLKEKEWNKQKKLFGNI